MTTFGGDIQLNGTLTLSGDITTEYNSGLNLNGDISFGSSAEVYTGAYEVIPKTVVQSLETTNKLMTRDVLVYEIPYDETSNLYGTTVVIAS